MDGKSTWRENDLSFLRGCMMQLVIPKESENGIEKYFNENYSCISPNWRNGFLSSISEERAEERISILKELLENDLKTKKILEIGSGSGILIAKLIMEGAECYGIEPDEKMCMSSSYIFQKNDIDIKVVRAIGENIPFKGDYFDLIISFQVVEHVEDVESVIRETKRLLKKNGLIYFVIPNYYSFWEGHYGVLWLPLFNKSLAKIYVKLLKRDSSFIDTLHFIIPKKIRNIFNDAGLEVVSMGELEWMERMKSVKFNTWGNTYILQKIVLLLKKLRMNTIVAKLFLRLDMYYPIIIVGKK